MNKKLINEEQNKELLKLVEENPTLPLVFFADSEDVCSDYSYTFMKSRRVKKGVIYESDINDDITDTEFILGLLSILKGEDKEC